MRRTVVFGASPNPARYSNMAVRQLESHHFDVIALGRRQGTIGRTSIVTDFPKSIDQLHTISLYLGPQNQEPYYDYLIGLNPIRVIFNPGTENIPFIRRLRGLGIEVEIACTLAMLSIGDYMR